MFMPKIKVISVTIHFDTSNTANSVPKIIHQINALQQIYNNNNDYLQFVFVYEVKWSTRATWKVCGTTYKIK